MVIKPRPVPDDLKIMRSLNTRMNLSEKEKTYYSNREKGFEGELMFDKLTEKLQSSCLILNDLLLEVKNNEFQIDSNIIFQETIYLFDVKNYDGDFFCKGDRFYTRSGDEIKNPQIQLQRCESLFRQYLQNPGMNFSVEAYVVFINPEFTLYQAALDTPFIFPNQLTRFMKKLNMKQSTLSERHTKLANQLIADHKTKSRYTLLPQYEYEKVQKGVTSASCNSFNVSVRERNLVCEECGAEEDIDSAVIRTVEEFKLLFPERKITTNQVQEWCQIVESKKTIGRILKKYYKAMGYGQWSYYE